MLGQMFRTATILGATMVVTALLLLIALPPIGFCLVGLVVAVPLIRLPKSIPNLYFLAIGPLTGLLAAQLASMPIIESAPDASPGWTTLGLTTFGLMVGIFVAFSRARVELHPLALAALMVLLEWTATAAFPMNIALSQYRSGLMLALASVGGIWFVSLVVWWANVLFSRGVRRPKWLTLVGLALLLPPLPDGGTYRVAAIQTASLDSMELTNLQHLAANNADLSIWPEISALDWVSYFGTNPLAELSREHGAFITTYVDNATPLPHNVAALFSEGTLVAHYEKRKPFAGEARIHAAGNRIVVATCKGAKIGLNICFDSCYPWIIRDTARAGASIVALPTLDPNAPNGWIAAIHGAYDRFRAAENGVSIVRADAFFGSAIVTRTGGLQAAFRNQDSAVLLGKVASQPLFTVYKLLGDWVPWASLLVVIREAYLRVRRRKLSS
jgi:apolipoprotein N-acyltransferase